MLSTLLIGLTTSYPLPLLNLLLNGSLWFSVSPALFGGVPGIFRHFRKCPQEPLLIALDPSIGGLGEVRNILGGSSIDEDVFRAALVEAIL